ncbi:hypothetical protein EBR37_02080, partial [bacterium]|nr:hypothetical protein [bacterium]
NDNYKIKATLDPYYRDPNKKPSCSLLTKQELKFIGTRNCDLNQIWSDTNGGKNSRADMQNGVIGFNGQFCQGEYFCKVDTRCSMFSDEQLQEAKAFFHCLPAQYTSYEESRPSDDIKCNALNDLEILALTKTTIDSSAPSAPKLELNELKNFITKACFRGNLAFLIHKRVDHNISGVAGDSGYNLPDYTKMGTFFQEQSAAQKENTAAVQALTAAQQQAAAGSANAKNATFDQGQASRMGTEVPGTQPDWVNTLLTTLGAGGGVVSSALGGALGGGVANVSTKAVGGALNVGKNVVGGAVNVGKNVVGGIGGGFGAARGVLNTAAAANGMNIGVGEALALPGGALTTAALGVGAFAGGAALGYGAGELVDPGAEKRTAMLESIPGVKTGFKSLSSVLPSFLGGGGAEGPSQEDEAKTTEMFNRAKEKQKQRLQRQQAVSEAPTVEVPENQLKEVQKTASTEKAQQNQITNTISVSPTISIAQQAAANDKADLQKMIEAEVKKFGEGLLKIVEEKSKNTAKGTVTPPQSMRAQMAA